MLGVEATETYNAFGPRIRVTSSPALSAAFIEDTLPNLQHLLCIVDAITADAVGRALIVPVVQNQINTRMIQLVKIFEAHATHGAALWVPIPLRLPRLARLSRCCATHLVF